MEIIYLITYDNQTESVYTWCSRNLQVARAMFEHLKATYPDRNWSIEEKDVS